MVICRMLKIWCFILVVMGSDRVESSKGNLTSKRDVYDIENLVSELGLQFCTIVEIGQGICTLFLEVRESAESPLLPQGSVAEVFLGECQCSNLREWSLCHPRLIDARGETCRFKEATGRDPTSQRVHRRLCDFDHILAAKNRPCDCLKRFDEQQQHPVKGLGTCFRSPQPNTVCGKHSVCGVYSCHSAVIEGFTMVQCDRDCHGKQPFCEELTDKIPVVTSYWSEWTPDVPIGFSSVKASEASCLSANSRAPAFDCLGPGPYCCPPNDDNCFCDVEYTVTGKKVRRFTNVDSHINFARSVSRAKDKSPWKRLLCKVPGYSSYVERHTSTSQAPVTPHEDLQYVPSNKELTVSENVVTEWDPDCTLPREDRTLCSKASSHSTASSNKLSTHACLESTAKPSFTKSYNGQLNDLCPSTPSSASCIPIRVVGSSMTSPVCPSPTVHETECAFSPTAPCPTDSMFSTTYFTFNTLNKLEFYEIIKNNTCLPVTHAHCQKP